MRPFKLDPVTARVNPLPTGLRDTVSALVPEIGTATVHVLEATPGMAELGLADAAREAPGQEPIDPSDVLFVRGGAADLKLVLLNGAPVYAPFHIGGLINALDPGLLRSATLYLGGAPARYDGGLSYVMDLETRSGRPNLPHLDVGFDMLAARAVTGGRSDRACRTSSAAAPCTGWAPLRSCRIRSRTPTATCWLAWMSSSRAAAR
jgi:hypothetical protein